MRARARARARPVSEAVRRTECGSRVVTLEEAMSGAERTAGAATAVPEEEDRLRTVSASSFC